MINCRLNILVLVTLLCFSVAWADGAAPVRMSIVKIRAFIPPDARTAESLGTQREGNGVVIDTQGHILTIGYLILEAESIEIVRSDGVSSVAFYVGYDHATGFGVVKAGQSRGLAPLEMGRSDELEVGAPILLVGYGGSGAIRPANLIARGEFAGYWEYLLDEAFYVAPPHPEFAGAAMLNEKGHLMGIGSIITQIALPGYGRLACNMFVPIDLLKPILNDLIQKGRAAAPPKPWLGLNVDESHGRVFINRVHGESPAEMAGLQANDIVLNVNHEAVEGLADFYRKVWSMGNAGVLVPLTILQGNQIREISVRSSDRYKYLRIRKTMKTPRTTIEGAI